MVTGWCTVCGATVEVERELPTETHLLFLVVGVVLGGPAGIAVATVWTLDPHVAVFVGAAIPLVILGLARSTDRKHCPKCKSEIKAGSRGE